MAGHEAGGSVSHFMTLTPCLVRCWTSQCRPSSYWRSALILLHFTTLRVRTVSSQWKPLSSSSRCVCPIVPFFTPHNFASDTIILNTFAFVLADPPITQLEDREHPTDGNSGSQWAGITGRIQWEITCKELPISAGRASGNNQEILSTFSNYRILISCMRKTQTHAQSHAIAFLSPVSRLKTEAGWIKHGDIFNIFTK